MIAIKGSAKLVTCNLHYGLKCIVIGLLVESCYYENGLKVVELI